MPIPTPRKGKSPESKKAFLKRCISSIYDEYKDNKGQPVAICEQKWRDHVSKADYMIDVGDDTYAYFKSDIIEEA